MALHSLYYVIRAAPTNTHQSVTQLALYHATSNCPDLLNLYYPNPQSRWTWYARGPSRSSLRQSANARSRSVSPSMILVIRRRQNTDHCIDLVIRQVYRCRLQCRPQRQVRQGVSKAKRLLPCKPPLPSSPVVVEAIASLITAPAIGCSPEDEVSVIETQ
ncbi:hypothetical protein CSHISOI_03670 [Colletotrichum shisoi]|uniref:Uncharacterized protein n=1 Tax=Colletotrichum shisoi TaxID=2078593 RepID=A0A5Q4BYX6_9PEZI|nr:hypothetical protein CSHISOI_03670 [Colletotrichum shisoi]